MADNIRIVGEILSTQEFLRYNEDDSRLLSSFLIKEDFGQSNDYIEYFVYDVSGNLLSINYNYRSFKLPTTSYISPISGTLPIIEIDPIKDLKDLEYSSGEFNVRYNFFSNIISDADQQGLFLKEISADRTEIRVGSTILTNEQIESGSLNIINSYSGSSYFIDYIINFGDGNQVVAVNTALNKIESGYEVLFKLYEPLPDNISEKSSLWVVKEKVNPYIFEINLDRLILPPPPPQLRGPNFDIEIPNQNNVGTSYQNYNNLVNSINNLSTSSYQQFLSLFTSQSIDINTDYTNFSNFVFFSSAKKRLENFYNKVKEIEDYKTDIALYTISSSLFPNMINDLNRATASLNAIIAGFDGFEYYLYFESGSTLTSSLEYNITPFPKSGSSLPYSLLPTSSALVQQWYNWATGSANDYDDQNQNKLTFTVPTFIRDDENNEPYLTFLDMVGHYFDNIWIYINAVTDINLANNNLEKGVSKDLVYYVLESLGIKLYNQYGDIDNIDYLIGQSGSANWDNNFTSTGSYLNTIPRKDLVAESYKRIYHNLPLLLKTKGTTYGLQTLISTFGITGSTLVVKEYGGDLKSNTLDEFNNDKVRVITGSIVTGSVLSPHISVVEYPTASSQFRTNDLNYVDISFSPQDKIDIYASASIAASVPTWSIDDIIGDPGYQYSSSYDALETARVTYLSPLSASQLPYTASAASGSIAATDYNSFIRLIQFFDNSLFKMLQDFIPARTSLSTGVTISSPILERNKWSYANPSSTSEVEVNEGTIEGPTIGTEYTDIFQGLTGSRVAYYDGNFTGSEINVHSYFASGNFNPYLQPTASLTTGSIYVFEHTDYNVMLNNVSNSLVSRNRQKIESIFGTSNFITSSVELQDSYETLKTHQLSRYNGVKLSSVKYNDYTEGDISFGKTAVIDKNVVKLGLFSEVVPNRFLPRRNNAVLKYLVDIDGNLTELNLRNTHWEEVQNTFIAGDTASISQFNNQLYSNQKTTDGEKAIFDSGYVYSPILYFASCSGDPDIAFQNQGNPLAYLATAQNLSSSYFISGSAPLGYPLQGGFVLNLFNSPIDVNQGSTYWTNATLSTPATYSVVETGQYKVYANVVVNMQMSSSNSATWSLEMYSGSTKIQETIQSAFFGSTTGTCTEYSIFCDVTRSLSFRYTDCGTGQLETEFVARGESINICSRTVPVIVNGEGLVFPVTTCGTFSVPGSTTQSLTLTINNGYSNNTNYSNFLENDKISFRLRLVNATNNNFTASLETGNNGFVSISSLAPSTGYSFVSCSYVVGASDSIITFNTALSSFYGNDYFFSPNPTSGSVSPLYDDYGDVDYAFNPKPYDILILYLSDGTILEYTVLGIILDENTGRLSLILNAPLSNLAINDLTNGIYRRFLLLSRIKDETNVILNFIKREGKTSYGFLIADNISSNVLNNIDTITREVKQKLLNDQSAIDNINGGSF